MTLGTQRKPCIALMGEFSAGKSTLANLLIGADPLPVQIVATQLPPVCISYGDDAPYCINLEGERLPIDLHNLAGVKLDQLAYIQIFSAEDLLQQCDLMDMPGISDPNISSEVWERMIGRADSVLWCSHATQAWRQSEAAVWAEMPDTLYERSLLLLTRADKLRSQEDRERVLRRVRKETANLFVACLPISLLIATNEQDDYARWSQSGAEDFVKHLVTLLEQLNAEISSTLPQGANDAELRLPGFEGPEKQPMPSSSFQAPAIHSESPRVTPRRIARAKSSSPRPSAGATKST